MSNEIERLQEDVAQLKAMMRTYLLNAGLLVYADLYAVGQNEGGLYVSLFSSKANFRLCQVYPENVGKLPKWLQTMLPAEVGHEVPGEKSKAEAKGYILPMPRIAFTRWRLDNDPSNKDKWRFAEVIWSEDYDRWAQKQRQEGGAPPVQQQPVQHRNGAYASNGNASREAMNQKTDELYEQEMQKKRFESKGDAVRWAVKLGAFVDSDEASAAYDQVKARERWQSADEMAAGWRNTVEVMLRHNAAKRQ